MRLRGKVAFITGAGRGQGREVAALFAREGAKVIAADLDASSGEETVQLIRRRGGKALFVEGDVGIERDVKRMLDAGAKKFRALHILYNSAHALWRDRDAPATDLSEANLDRILTINLKGPLFVAKHGVPHLVRSGGGSIINVGCVEALGQAAPFHDAYAMAKGGLGTLTRSLALQFARQNIRCNILQPGIVERPLQLRPQQRRAVEAAVPLGRLAHPRDIASAALFLASDDAAYLTGAEIVVDGGLSLHRLPPH